jgi:hypothetical protein
MLANALTNQGAAAAITNATAQRGRTCLIESDIF